MTDLTPERAAAIQGITALAQALYQALESQDGPQILRAQQDLSAAAETVWARVQPDASIPGRDKAVVRVLIGAAINELPQDIQDPANYRKIKQHLRLLQSSLVVLG